MRQVPYRGPHNIIIILQNFVATGTCRMVFVHPWPKDQADHSIRESRSVRTDDIPSELITTHMKKWLCNSAHTFLIDSRSLLGLGTPRILMGESRYGSIFAWFRAFAAIWTKSSFFSTFRQPWTVVWWRSFGTFSWSHLHSSYGFMVLKYLLR